MKYNLITILGPTAVGKTRLGTLLANYFNGEIISADSRQVYRGMDIGTGKDIQDYTINGITLPYYMIDIFDPGEEFNLFEFNKKFYKYHEEISLKKKTPFLVGGTGLYINSILNDFRLVPAAFSEKRISELNKLELDQLQDLLGKLSPKLHNTTDLLIKERIIKAIIIEEAKNKFPVPDYQKINSFVIGVAPDRDLIKQRINKRLKERLNEGMVEEAESLLAKGITHEKLEFFGLEYRYLSRYIRGDLNRNDMYQKLASSIHKFAKRQMTYFRKMEKDGVKINWISSNDFDIAKELILKNIND